jgi:hypothetical protein
MLGRYEQQKHNIISNFELSLFTVLLNFSIWFIDILLE